MKLSVEFPSVAYREGPDKVVELAKAIEEIGFDRIPELFGLESAGHREAILDFLALARVKLPALLHQWQLIGPMERRSRLLRLEARRLAEHPPAGPGIAAGSPGSIPATRALLKSIAGLPIEAGASLVLESGGAHLMLLGLEDALKAGEELILTLEFANAGAVDVTVPVSANAPATTSASP